MIGEGPWGAEGSPRNLTAGLETVLCRTQLRVMGCVVVTEARGAVFRQGQAAVLQIHSESRCGLIVTAKYLMEGT